MARSSAGRLITVAQTKRLGSKALVGSTRAVTPRAVDHEGAVLEMLVQRRRNKCAAIKLMRKLLRKQGFAPKTVTTDKLRSYGAAFQHLGLPATMSRDCDRTIGPKTATKWYGGVSARCSALSQPDRPSDSSASTPPPTTTSTFNAT